MVEMLRMVQAVDGRDAQNGPGVRVAALVRKYFSTSSPKDSWRDDALPPAESSE